MTQTTMKKAGSSLHDPSPVGEPASPEAETTFREFHFRTRRTSSLHRRFMATIRVKSLDVFTPHEPAPNGGPTSRRPKDYFAKSVSRTRRTSSLHDGFKVTNPAATDLSPLTSAPVRKVQSDWRRILRFLAPIWVCFALLPQSGFACRYNVRDIGFIDLDEPSYILYGFAAGAPEQGFSQTLAKIGASAFEDCNVRTEIIDTEKQKTHPALKHFNPSGSSPLPSLALVSPDGQSQSIPYPETSQDLEKTLASRFASLASSPIREEILDKICKSFGVILLIEGTDSQQNDRARQAIQSSIDRIKEQMPWMPKVIAHPPEMVTLSAEALASERVLLWSFGLNTEPAKAPRAAVVFGKARWIGPLMEGEEIAEQNVAGIFSIIGADCECSFDISWTQGTRLPVKWERSRHAEVVKSLGFDPENPLIKMEASRILRRGAPATPSPSPGQMMAALADTAPAASTVSVKQQVFGGTTNSAARTPPNEIMQTEEESPFHYTWFVMGGLILLVAGASLWIAFQSKVTGPSKS